MKKGICLWICLCLCLIGLTGCAGRKADTDAAPAKTVTLTIVHGDGTQKEFTAKSGEQYLGKAVESLKILEGTKGEYGLFVTKADGESADQSKQQWWCLTKAGGQVDTGIDSTPFADGDHFELTLKTGY